MEKYKILPVKYNVYNEDVNPIYGEGVTSIEIADEGSGAFITLSQEDNTMHLDFDELYVLINIIRTIEKEYPRNLPDKYKGITNDTM